MTKGLDPTRSWFGSVSQHRPDHPVALSSSSRSHDPQSPEAMSPSPPSAPAAAGQLRRRNALALLLCLSHFDSPPLRCPSARIDHARNPNPSGCSGSRFRPSPAPPPSSTRSPPPALHYLYLYLYWPTLTTPPHRQRWPPRAPTRARRSGELPMSTTSLCLNSCPPAPTPSILCSFTSMSTAHRPYFLDSRCSTRCSMARHGHCLGCG